MSERPLIDASFLGLVPYEKALRLQMSAHGAIAAERLSGVCLALEHPSVLTLGRNASARHLLEKESVLNARGIAVVATERGGEVTAHMPGQLIVYPILPLTRMGIGVRAYVHALEEAVIRTLVAYGIRAARDAVNPGVWVGSEKICALGVRVKERISLHGLALNVSNELKLFESIVPCGIQDRGVTSIRAQTGEMVSLSECANRLVTHLADIMGFSVSWARAEALVANLDGNPYDAGPNEHSRERVKER